MRILFVVHDFLPAHPSGTEIHTAELGERLRARGHEVHVFTTEKDIGRLHLSLERRMWQGLVVHELVNNLFYRSFRETWDFPPAAAVFARLLDDIRPDVVHFMHLLYLSSGCVEEAARRGIPVFFTLHDYWLQCARFGQLIHADGSICHTIDFARCGTCLAQLKYSQTPLERGVARFVARVHALFGLDLAPLVRRVGARRPTRPLTAPDGRAHQMELGMAERDEGLRGRIVPHVRRFYAPSRFIRSRFLAWGIPEEKIEVLPNAIDLRRFREHARAPRSPDSPMRVAFIGTLAPHKAPHLLLEAWSRLGQEVRAGATLTIFGPRQHYPDYVAALERRAADLAARMGGALEPQNVARALREIDLLVIPSVWLENAPLTLLEARAARTAVLASDIGGMAEMVESGRNGWTFRSGDVEDLARHLRRLLADPGLLERLDFGGEPLRDLDRLAQDLEERYRAAVRADRDPRDAGP